VVDIVRTLGFGLFLLAAAAGVGFFFFTMPIMDRRMNRMLELLQEPVSPEGQALHAGLAVADLHADPLLWPRPIVERSRNGHLDLPRLVEGGVALQVFSAVTQVPKGLNYIRNDSTSDMIRLVAMASRWPIRTWSSRVERALHQAARFDRAVAASGGRLVAIRSTADLSRLLAERASHPGLVGGLLAIEGAHAAEGTLANLERLYAAGYRMIGLTHFFDNQVGGSSAGVKQGGLTAFGRRAVQWMEGRRVIVDLAHASPALIADVLAVATRGVVVSHSGVQGTCPGPRNLSDGTVRAIAADGGVIGVGFWEAAVCGLEPDTVAAAIRYAVDLAGVEHVALGSDFDGGTTTSFDAADYVLVTDALLRRGFTPGEVRAIMGGNVLRFLMENLPPD
jgi:microsomal dipeptidase-like Zn-dependent dipeptidase